MLNNRVHVIICTSRADYDKYENQAGLPVIGWNAGERAFDYLNNEQYQNLPK